VGVLGGQRDGRLELCRVLVSTVNGGERGRKEEEGVKHGVNGDCDVFRWANLCKRSLHP
jgi:hypothetical protein